jgi:hypothetical protein
LGCLFRLLIKKLFVALSLSQHVDRVYESKPPKTGIQRFCGAAYSERRMNVLNPWLGVSASLLLLLPISFAQQPPPGAKNISVKRTGSPVSAKAQR